MRKMNVTKRALRVYHGYNPNYFPLKFLQILFQNVSPYFNLWMSSEIVTALYKRQARDTIYLLVAITLLGNLLIRILEAVLGRSVATQAEISSHREAAAFHAKTLSLDYDKIENPEIRQHRRKITENKYINGYGIQNMRSSVEALFTSLIHIVFSLTLFAEMLYLITMIPFRWPAAVLLAALVACMALQILFQSYAMKRTSVEHETLGNLALDENRLGQGYRTNDMDSRIYCQERIITCLQKKFGMRHMKVFSKACSHIYRAIIPTVVFSVLSELCSYLIICFYCTLGAFPVGSVIKYVGYLGMFTEQLRSLFFVLNAFKENERFLKCYLDYFDIPNDLYQGSLAVENRSDKKFDIEFKNVSFRYAGAEEDALKHINLRLSVGERLAVVGRNGSGKTTFIKLLCRLYDPTEGEIYMNDFNIRKYDYRRYLDLFSVVFQDYHLLALPLGNNVASAEVWDTVKAERILEKVGFGNRYAEMPRKLETPLYKEFDEDGVLVSGGEAQKIALARALYKDAPFIILDEPTAALDPIAEAEIYTKFNEIVGDKTAIYISHRLSSCRFCDRIAVFDNGEIVQIGTHAELLANPAGKYYELWHAQAQYYTKQ